jgi:hypothetical protein
MQTIYVPGRKYHSAKKKYHQALKVFETADGFTLGKTFIEPKPKKHSMEFTTYFWYQGEKYRLDYEINLETKLPYVRDIRTFLWESLQDYRRSVQQRGSNGNPGVASPYSVFA